MIYALFKESLDVDNFACRKVNKFPGSEIYGPHIVGRGRGSLKMDQVDRNVSTQPTMWTESMIRNVCVFVCFQKTG